MTLLKDCEKSFLKLLEKAFFLNTALLIKKKKSKQKLQKTRLCNGSFLLFLTEIRQISLNNESFGPNIQNYRATWITSLQTASDTAPMQDVVQTITWKAGQIKIISFFFFF